MSVSTLEELRQFVTAKDGKGRFNAQTVCLTISHSNLSQKWIEIRFDKSETIGGVKLRLYKHGGTPPELQKLILMDANRTRLGELSEDNLTLGQYGVQNDYEIRIVDLDSNSLAKSGWLEDVSLVEKYVMSEEDYEARVNTVRKYKQKLAQEQEADKPQQPFQHVVVDENLIVGKRCEVGPGARRGEIKFVGEISALDEGIWVGICLDEPLGKNDGVIKGRKLFSCPPNHGVFARPNNVKVGDYPVRNLDDDSDDEI